MENDLILSLETATRGGSLALMHGRSLIASTTGIAAESHSVNLLSRIESLLAEAHITLRDINLFATVSGPGSFTGLRIGLATIKAFAAVFNRPCIGVPTLEAIAFAAGAWPCTYALLPAGRGEVFAQAWESSQERSQAEHIPPHDLLQRIREVSSIHWAGPGAHLYKDLIRERAAALGINFTEDTHNGRNANLSAGAGGDIRWTLALNVEQLAQYVAILALQHASSTKPHRPEDLRALYVRPSDAELNK